MFKRKWWTVVAVLVVLSLLFAACGGDDEEEEEAAAPAEGRAVTLAVWAQANEVEHWRADGPAKAAADVTDFDITVDALNDSASWGDYKKKVVLASDAGDGPAIAVSGHEDVPVWGNAGYIVDFEFCRDKYPEFDDVIEGLWESVTWQGKLWGVPQDTEARPMYFNKPKLKELGWSDAEVEGLPDKIKDGHFTLDDLIATAKEAVEKGVVEPGYGYWHRPVKGGDYLQYYFSHGGRLYDPGEDKLVLDKSALLDWFKFQRQLVEEGITPENYIGTEWSIFHDTVSHGKALFWNGGVWQWADWAENYVADEGGQDYLFENVGYALQPSGIEGQPGGTLSHPLVYMIMSDKASGAKDQDAACALLAKTTTAEINTLHAVGSTHLGIVNAQADYADYKNDKLLADTLYMLDYNYYQPNHVQYGPYFDIVWDGMVKAENGDLTPQQAVDEVLKLMELELGDDFVIIVE